jgi:ADP-ribose pyrophosphatase
LITLYNPVAIKLNKPVLVEERELFKGLRFSVSRRRYAKEGGLFERDVVVFPHAVVILPFISRGEVVLIKQFRAPFNDFIIEAPAGVVDSGESPEDTARRELVEEIGYYPRRLHKLGSFMPSPGYSTEILHFYTAEELEYVGARPEKYEVIEPLRITLEEAYKMVLENKIVDAKTALLILLYRSIQGVSQ